MSELDLATKLDIVTDYYGAGTIWDRMSISGLSPDQINAMYNSLPASSFSIDRTPSGLNLGRSYTNPFELPVVPGTDFDSNIPGGSYGGGNTFSGNVPANLELDPTTGLPVRQTAGPLTSGGVNLPAIADRISLAVMGVNIGAKLGMAIDSALYSINPSWWDEHLPTINPQTWSSLVGQNPVGDFFLRALFGIQGDKMTGYVDANVLAYYYQMLRDMGAFNTGGQSAETDSVRTDLQYPNALPSNIPIFDGNVTPSYSRFNNIYYYYPMNNSDTVYITISNVNSTLRCVAASKSSFVLHRKYMDGSGTWHDASIAISSLIRNYPNDFYNVGNALPSDSILLAPYATISGSLSPATYDTDIGYTMVWGSKSTTPSIDGISQMPNATQYPPTNITGQTPQEVNQQLRQQYPDLYQDTVTETTMQDDGTTTTTEYVPIPWVTDGKNPQQPTTTDGRDQTSTDVDEQTGQQVLPTTPTDEQTQPPDTGDGSTPPVVVPTGSASSLWAVYNPSQSEINSFGAWLWSSNFVEQIKKLFADPMQAIIGVHKVFASPHTSGSQTIKCGYLDSGVSAAVVSNQYTTVDCGSASLREYFGNVFDYDPFTKVSIFLPFIGIVPLNTADVMRSTVSVKYTVDVITGACLAEVSISRDGGGGILYTYGGSAIVTYPVSSGSYVGAVQAALSTAIGIGSAIASGGASLGASAGMVLGGLSHARTQVQHSGQFSGSSGAMGGKKPYLIVSRPQTRTPSKIGNYKGKPSNAIHKLSSCTGYVKVNEVHVISTSAYDNELQEIESLLKSGVII